MHLRTSAIFAALATIIAEGVAPAADPVDIGTRRELFVDHFLIDKLAGARLQLHHPRREGPAVRFVDKPWEGHLSGYVTVLKDGPLYRMYYRGRSELGRGDRNVVEVTCVAESEDGIRWTKPALGLYEIHGTRENNVVLADKPPYSHNFSPWIDTRPGVPARERYKSLSGLYPEGLALFVSADGLRWTLEKEPAVTYPGKAFDSQACAFWSDSEGQYVCYFRTFKNGMRWISRTTSRDCRSWTTPVEMHYGDTPPEQFYTNMTQPYYRAPHIYIALAQRFSPRRSALPEAESARLVPDAALRGFSSDVALMSTRGGRVYHRTFLESFIRPGRTARDWASRNNTAAWGIVPAAADPRTLYIYRQADVAQPTNHAIRYSLRVDGFASVWAPFAGGELITKPLIFRGSRLEINFDTSAAGSIRVELQDPSGRPLPGFVHEDCEEILGNEISRVVRWRNREDLGALAGKPIRLRFVMKDADLYSLRFQ